MITKFIQQKEKEYNKLWAQWNFEEREKAFEEYAKLKVGQDCKSRKE